MYFLLDLNKISTQVFPTAFKYISHAKYEKTLILTASSFFAFYNILTLPKFCSEVRPHTLCFFYQQNGNLQWKMLGDSFNINNLCCNPEVQEKR